MTMPTFCLNHVHFAVTMLYMWQSRVENVHYSISMKIGFNTENDASGHHVRGSRLLAPLCMRVTSYRPQNTAHFGLVAILIFAT